ncbi:nuclear transport factor 2 family protein [Psychromicrobium sp. YIM B11713]|uniref:nuclear transport factor 2 family protein n=1 Tax=Psychromicrobium sp. YIM B11713 TaxID=3145233 RepID=UPI00374F03E7
MSRSDEITEISQLILHERQGRDRGWWQQMREAFALDSAVKISWYRGDGPGFVTSSERMSGAGDTAVHRLSPPSIHLKGARAIAELSCGVELQVEIHGIPAHLISYARLNYRLHQEAAGWKVVQFDAIYERDTLTPAFPGDQLQIDKAEATKYRPSYALLAYYLRSQGYDVKDDLLGDDEPQRVELFYDELREWLEAEPQSAHSNL